MKRERLYVHPLFKKQLKLEAVEEGLNVIELTKKKAKEKNPFICINDKKKKKDNWL